MKKLRMAVQKSGRLSEKSMELLKRCGVGFSYGSRTLIADSNDFPVEILFLRDDDIPQYVQDGVADVGIIGENVLIESGANANIALRLGFARCRMSLAVPKSFEYNGSVSLKGLKIATSYPSILRQYLKEKMVDAEIHVIAGSVEIAPTIGLADAIFDIVSTGSTLISNGLREVETILQSEAVIMARKDLDDDKSLILNELIFRIQSVQNADKNRYVLLNAPNEKLSEICSIIPGMKSPTVLPLAESGWSSVHSVMSEIRFWEIIGKLKLAGAEGILVVPIEKMVL